MFKFEDWAFTRDQQYFYYGLPYWMDKTHVEFIYSLLTLDCWQKVLEIGCFDGSSTAAIVQAINDGASFEAHVVDVNLRPILMRVLQATKHLIYAHQNASINVLNSSFDLVIIDGDHSLNNVQAEARILLSGTSFVAHDVACELPECAGTRWLLDAVRSQANYHYLLDCQPRPGQYTQRGLLFATPYASIIDLVHPVWDMIMSHGGIGG